MIHNYLNRIFCVCFSLRGPEFRDYHYYYFKINLLFLIILLFFAFEYSFEHGIFVDIAAKYGSDKKHI